MAPGDATACAVSCVPCGGEDAAGIGEDEADADVLYGHCIGVTDPPRTRLAG